MAESANSTPARTDATDAELVAAYRRLEGSISELRSMVSLMEIAVLSTVHKHISPTHDLILKAAPWTRDYRVVVMTKDEAEGLSYSLTLMGDLVRNLSIEYDAGFVGKVA